MTSTQQIDRVATPTRTEPRLPLPVRPRPAWERAVASALPAVIVISGLFAWMVLRSASGLNTAGRQMPGMDLQHRVAYWWPFLMGETLGIAALIWSYLSVAVGLLFSSGPGFLGLTRAQLTELHRHLSLTTIALIASHVLFVAVGSMNGAMTVRTIDVRGALLPFQTSWNGVFYNVGIFAFYLSLLLGPTYYLRRRIGVRTWKVLHRATLAVYVLAVWHTFGFDDFDFHGPYRMALWIAQIPLACLLLWRLLAPAVSAARGSARNARIFRLAAAVVAAALVATLIGVVVTGRIGGTASPFGEHASSRPATGGAVHQSTPMPGMPGM